MGLISSVIQLPQGGRSIPVNFSITDASNNAVDLTNTSTVFRMAKPNSLIDKTSPTGMAIQSATGGVTQYTFTAADLSDTNDSGYNAEITLNYTAGNSSGRIVKIDGILIQVTPEEPI